MATPATTIEGVYVKARATAWAIENEFGLLDPTKEPSSNSRLAASIVRDLLNLTKREFLRGDASRMDRAELFSHAIEGDTYIFR